MEYQVQSLGDPRQLPANENLRKRRIKEALWGYFFILPQMIGILAFALIPLIVVFYLSVNSWDGLGQIQFVGLQNFIDQFQGTDLRIAFVNTLLYTLIVVPGGLVLALLVALGLHRV